MSNGSCCGRGSSRATLKKPVLMKSVVSQLSYEVLYTERDFEVRRSLTNEGMISFVYKSTKGKPPISQNLRMQVGDPAEVGFNGVTKEALESIIAKVG